MTACVSSYQMFLQPNNPINAVFAVPLCLHLPKNNRYYFKIKCYEIKWKLSKFWVCVVSTAAFHRVELWPQLFLFIPEPRWRHYPEPSGFIFMRSQGARKNKWPGLNLLLLFSPSFPLDILKRETAAPTVWSFIQKKGHVLPTHLGYAPKSTSGIRTHLLL